MSVCIDWADRFAGAIDEALAKGRTKPRQGELSVKRQHKGPRCQFNEITQGARSVAKKDVPGLPFSQDLA